MVKSKINLKDPATKALVVGFRKQCLVAYDATAKMDNAVRPIYALNTRTDRVEQVGSSVLLMISGHTFALSASHVFDSVGQYQLLLGCGNQLHSLAGDRFSSARGLSGSHRDDPIDASVFHITADVPPEVSASALSIENLDLLPADFGQTFYVAAGYRVAESRSTPRGHTTLLQHFPSIESGQEYYDAFKVDRHVHLLIGSEDEVLIEDNWQTAPSLKGLSGGAMFRVSGVPLLPKNSIDEGSFSSVTLAAILISRRQGNPHKLHSVAMGTRLGVHLGLIDQYLPELNLHQLLLSEISSQGAVDG